MGRGGRGTDSLHGHSEHLNFQPVNTLSVSSTGKWAYNIGNIFHKQQNEIISDVFSMVTHRVPPQNVSFYFQACGLLKSTQGTGGEFLRPGPAHN